MTWSTFTVVCKCPICKQLHSLKVTKTPNGAKAKDGTPLVRCDRCVMARRAA
jgi:hypothetical protein